MLNIIKSFIFGMVLLSLSHAALSSWVVTPIPFPNHDAVAGSEGLWLATGGGLRFIGNDGTTRIYTSQNGLEETPQIAVVRTSGNFVYSFSETGIVSRISTNGEGLRVLSRSFRESGVQVLSGKVRSAGEYLFIPFSDKLTLFNGKTGLSVVTWSILGKFALSENRIQDMLVRNDTVFVQCPNLVLKRRIPTDSISYLRNLPDPSLWIVDSNSSEFSPLHFPDQLVPDSLGSVQIEGKDWTDSLFCPGRVCTPYWIAHVSKSRHWIGDSLHVWRIDGNKREDFSKWDGLPYGPVSAVDPLSDGNVAVWQNSMLSVLNKKGVFKKIPYSLLPLSDDPRQNAMWPLKSLHVDDLGSLFLGTWGAGVYYTPNWLDAPQTGMPALLSPTYGFCLEPYFYDSTGFTYTIVTGVAPHPSGQGVFAQYWGNSRGTASGLAYVSSNGLDVQCMREVGSQNRSGAMVVSPIASTKNLRIFAAQVSNSEGGDGGVDIHEVTDPRTGVGFNNLSTLHIRGISIGSPRDMAFDSKHNRLWVVGTKGIGYWEDGVSGDSISNESVFIGATPADLSGIEMDLQGNLWASSYSRGVFVLKPRHGNPDTLEVTNYTSRDGLLSNRVYDLGLSTVTGTAWFSHDIGVSALHAIQVRSAANFQEKSAPPVMAYPNPFRPGKHAKVIFDYLSEEAKLKITDASGNLIREFSGSSLKGGRLEWDGRNQKGQLVAPGLYHWIAVHGSRSQYGRIMIIR